MFEREVCEVGVERDYRSVEGDRVMVCTVEVVNAKVGGSVRSLRAHRFNLMLMATGSFRDSR